MSNKLFISYSRKDEYFARALAVDLEESGAEIWIDVDDIPVGSRWSSAIQQGLRESQVMLLIISADAMTSRNVEDEWNYFLDKQKPIIILYWRSCEPHFQLWRSPRVEFRPHKVQYQKAFHEMVTLLKEHGVHLTPPRDLPSTTNSFVRKALGKAIEKALQGEQENPRAQTDSYKRQALLPPSRRRIPAWGWVAISVCVAIILVLGASAIRWQWDKTAEADISPTTGITSTATLTQITQIRTIPSVTERLVITPSTSEPSATPTPSDLVLVYGADTVYLWNRSNLSQNVSELRFVQVRGNGAQAVFEASAWSENDPMQGGDSVYNLRPNHCFQVGTSIQKAQLRPADCRQMNSWLFRGSQRAHFWLAQDDQTYNFTIYWKDQPVTTCELSVGYCEFDLEEVRS